MKFLKSISLYLLFSAIFFMKTTGVFAASGAAVNYINTVYALMLCESGSTLSSCSNPLIIKSTPSGTNMNIGGVNAGESAGSYGNLNVLVPGTTYTYGQVVLDRSFTISGTGKDDVGGDDCQTSSSGAAGTATSFAVGKEGTGTGENQTVYAANGTGNGDAMNSTPNVNSSTTGDAAAGTLSAGHSYMKFRWELATPYTYTGTKIPKMTISFDLSSGLSFNGNCGGAAGTTHGITPGSPVITNVLFE